MSPVPTGTRLPVYPGPSFTRTEDPTSRVGCRRRRTGVTCWATGKETRPRTTQVTEDRGHVLGDREGDPTSEPYRYHPSRTQKRILLELRRDRTRSRPYGDLVEDGTTREGVTEV